jgi:hypothetical protein
MEIVHRLLIDLSHLFGGQYFHERLLPLFPAPPARVCPGGQAGA